MRYLISLLAACGVALAGTTIGTGTVETLQVGIAAAAPGLDKTSLIAWYDFDDATDSHTGGYDLAENGGTPTYTSGYGSSTSSVNWTNGVVAPLAFPATGTDSTVVMRIRIPAGTTSGSNPWHVSDSREKFTWISGGASRLKIYDNASYLSGGTLATDTWYCVVMQWDSATSETKLWVDGTEYGPQSVTPVRSGVVGLGIGCNASYGTFAPCDFDYMAFYTRKLTADERTWLYNSGGTRTYADLD